MSLNREEVIRRFRAVATQGGEAAKAWAYIAKGADPFTPAFLKTFGHLIGVELALKQPAQPQPRPQPGMGQRPQAAPQQRQQPPQRQRPPQRPQVQQDEELPDEGDHMAYGGLGRVAALPPQRSSHAEDVVYDGFGEDLSGVDEVDPFGGRPPLESVEVDDGPIESVDFMDPEVLGAGEEAPGLSDAASEAESDTES